MWAALIATSIAGWLHQLSGQAPDTDTGDTGLLALALVQQADPIEPVTSTPTHTGLLGLGVRDGKAMIETLQHQLTNVPARLTRHAAALHLRPHGPDQQPEPAELRPPEATLGHQACPHRRRTPTKKINKSNRRPTPHYSQNRVRIPQTPPGREGSRFGDLRSADLVFFSNPRTRIHHCGPCIGTGAVDSSDCRHRGSRCPAPRLSQSRDVRPCPPRA